jgi:hypothetical protein
MQPRGTIGGTGTQAGEAIALKRHGLGAHQAGHQHQAMTRGAQLINDAVTLGGVKARTPFSFSCAGHRHRRGGIGSRPARRADARGVHPAAGDVEVVRPSSLGSTLAIVAAATTRYLRRPGYVALNAAADPAVRGAVRRRGHRATCARVCSIATGAGTDTLVFTVQKSSDGGATWADTALTCTITGNSAKSASDLTDAAVLAAGDVLAVKMVSNGTTAVNPGFAVDVT